MLKSCIKKKKHICMLLDRKKTFLGGSSTEYGPIKKTNFTKPMSFCDEAANE